MSYILKEKSMVSIQHTFRNTQWLNNKFSPSSMTGTIFNTIKWYQVTNKILAITSNSIISESFTSNNNNIYHKIKWVVFRDICINRMYICLGTQTSSCSQYKRISMDIMISMNNNTTQNILEIIQIICLRIIIISGLGK